MKILFIGNKNLVTADNPSFEQVLHSNISELSFEKIMKLMSGLNRKDDKAAEKADFLCKKYTEKMDSCPSLEFKSDETLEAVYSDMEPKEAFKLQGEIKLSKAMRAKNALEANLAAFSMAMNRKHDPEECPQECKKFLDSVQANTKTLYPFTFLEPEVSVARPQSSLRYKIMSFF